MTAAQLDPFRRIVGVKWRSGDEPTEPPFSWYWAIISSGSNAPETNYEGEADDLRNLVISETTGYDVFEPSTGHDFGTSPPPAIQAAWDALLAAPHIIRYELIKFEVTTEAPTPPVDMLEWTTHDSSNGWNFYFWGIGRDASNNPTPVCPPAAYVSNGAHWTEEHCVNWRNWQISLGGGTSSYTLFYAPGPGEPTEALYCIPGS